MRTIKLCVLSLCSGLMACPAPVDQVEGKFIDDDVPDRYRWTDLELVSPELAFFGTDFNKLLYNRWNDEEGLIETREVNLISELQNHRVGVYAYIGQEDLDARVCDPNHVHQSPIDRLEVVTHLDGDEGTCGDGYKVKAPCFVAAADEVEFNLADVYDGAISLFSMQMQVDDQTFNVPLHQVRIVAGYEAGDSDKPVLRDQRVSGIVKKDDLDGNTLLGPLLPLYSFQCFSVTEDNNGNAVYEEVARDEEKVRSAAPTHDACDVEGIEITLGFKSDFMCQRETFSDWTPGLMGGPLSGNAVAPWHCGNGKLDESEANVDCGGRCAPCGTGHDVQAAFLVKNYFDEQGKFSNEQGDSLHKKVMAAIYNLVWEGSTAHVHFGVASSEAPETVTKQDSRTFTFDNSQSVVEMGVPLSGNAKAPLTCRNGVFDGPEFESGLDCGGPCVPCGTIGDAEAALKIKNYYDFSGLWSKQGDSNKQYKRQYEMTEIYDLVWQNRVAYVHYGYRQVNDQSGPTPSEGRDTRWFGPTGWPCAQRDSTKLQFRVAAMEASTTPLKSANNLLSSALDDFRLLWLMELDMENMTIRTGAGAVPESRPALADAAFCEADWSTYVADFPKMATLVRASDGTFETAEPIDEISMPVYLPFSRDERIMNLPVRQLTITKMTLSNDGTTIGVPKGGTNGNSAEPDSWSDRAEYSAWIGFEDAKKTPLGALKGFTLCRFMCPIPAHSPDPCDDESDSTSKECEFAPEEIPSSGGELGWKLEGTIAAGATTIGQ